MFEWKKEQQSAFKTLKKRLIKIHLFRYPNHNQQYILMTDAIGVTVGAVLR